jgi:hypothetical protein
MGVQSSVNYSTTEEVSKIVNNVVLSNNSTCSGSTQLIQSITLGDIGGDLNIDGLNWAADQTFNLNCMQSSENNAALIADIKKELEKSIQSKLDGQNLGIQSSVNYSTTSAISDVVNSIKIDNIKKCIGAAISEQTIQTGKIAGNAILRNINYTASQSVVQNCMQSDTNTASAIAKLDTKIKEDMSATITGFLSSNGFIVIAVIALVLLLLFFKGKKSKGE